MSISLRTQTLIAIALISIAGCSQKSVVSCARAREYLSHDDDVALGRLIQQGCSVNSQIDGDVSWLSIASSEGKPRCLALLLNSGAKVNAQYGPTQDTALHLACLEEQLGSVLILVKFGADVRKVNGIGSTPLTLACRGTNPRLVETLIQNGADVNRADYRGLTALHYAAEARPVSPDVIRILVSHGASKTLRTKSGATPTELALKVGNKEVLQLLRK